MEGGEVKDRNGKMPKKSPKKKKTSLLERGIETILAVFLAYLSGSATGAAQGILLVGAIALVLYAIFTD